MRGKTCVLRKSGQNVVWVHHPCAKGARNGVVEIRVRRLLHMALTACVRALHPPVCGSCFLCMVLASSMLAFPSPAWALRPPLRLLALHLPLHKLYVGLACPLWALHPLRRQLGRESPALQPLRLHEHAAIYHLRVHVVSHARAHAHTGRPEAAGQGLHCSLGQHPAGLAARPAAPARLCQAGHSRTSGRGR